VTIVVGTSSLRSVPRQLQDSLPLLRRDSVPTSAFIFHQQLFPLWMTPPLSQYAKVVYLIPTYFANLTPSRVAGFFGYFAVLSLLMLPAAVAFARRKTSRWFLLSAGLLLLIGGALNWWGLLPTFSWNGYEPDWPPICIGAFLVMMLLAIFGNVSRRRRRQR